MAWEIITIAGPIPAEQLGVTMMHEHIVIDIRHIWTGPGAEDYVLDELDVAEREIREYVQAGGKTIVDTTNISMPRNLSAVAEIARSTGLQVIAATGSYLQRSYPPYIFEARADEIADVMIREVQEGMDGTGMRADIIGEIGAALTHCLPSRRKSFAQQREHSRRRAWRSRHTRLLVSVDHEKGPNMAYLFLRRRQVTMFRPGSEFNRKVRVPQLLDAFVEMVRPHLGLALEGTRISESDMLYVLGYARCRAAVGSTPASN